MRQEIQSHNHLDMAFSKNFQNLVRLIRAYLCENKVPEYCSGFTRGTGGIFAGT
jgi:hypothetical protein